MPSKIAAIVVTYNRKQLLMRCLTAMKAQARVPDRIIVLDNASTDGTREQLESAGYLADPTVTYERMAENAGMPAAIGRGMILADSLGYDWYWIMDDDAEPQPGALASLCRYLQPALLGNEDYCLFTCHVNRDGTRFSEPISVVENGKVRECVVFSEVRNRSLVETLGGPFLGVLVPRSALSRVGVPNEGMFIWGDYEYMGRLRAAGYRIFYDTGSLLVHPEHSFMSIRLPSGLWRWARPFWREYRVPRGAPWKQYYGIRNVIYYSLHASGQRGVGALVKVLASQMLRGAMVIATEKPKGAAVRAVAWAIVDGLRANLVRRMSP
jgi:GT2 family glycosyltransferase